MRAQPAASEKEEIRALIRELHEAVQEARSVRRALEETLERARTSLLTEFNEQVLATVHTGLEEFHGSIERQIKAASAAVMARFDRMSSILMGETNLQRRRGDAPLETVIRRIAAWNHGLTAAEQAAEQAERSNGSGA